jgi:hypothetical protein
MTPLLVGTKPQLGHIGLIPVSPHTAVRMVELRSQGIRQMIFYSVQIKHRRLIRPMRAAMGGKSLLQERPVTFLKFN